MLLALIAGRKLPRFTCQVKGLKTRSQLSPKHFENRYILCQKNHIEILLSKVKIIRAWMQTFANVSAFGADMEQLSPYFLAWQHWWGAHLLYSLKQIKLCQRRGVDLPDVDL